MRYAGSMKWLRFAVAAGWVGATILAAACREPTEITISITTDVPCNEVALAGGVAIRVGTSASVESNASSAVVAPDCKAGAIGTLAIVPSKSVDDQVAIEVAVASRSNPALPFIKSVDCDSQNPGNCIIAKRVLRYIPHTALDLPIHLSLKCAGVKCANANETCVDGVCVGVTPDCTIDNTCRDADSPREAGKDATFVDAVGLDGTSTDGKLFDAADSSFPPDSASFDAKPDQKSDGSTDSGSGGPG